MLFNNIKMGVGTLEVYESMSGLRHDGNADSNFPEEG